MFTNLSKIKYLFKRNRNRYAHVKIQYASDIHMCTRKYIPQIEPVAKYLALCGDIGDPTNPNFNKFIKSISCKFDKIFIVAGNHDYNCSPMYNEKNVNRYKPALISICDLYPNIILLDKSVYFLTEDIIVAGTTLWSNPAIKKNYTEHITEHCKHVEWIENICKIYPTKKIVMMTHFVPSFKLITPNYLKRGINATSWFATDLEHLITEPIVAWICGHSHSIIDVKINNIYCGINALGHVSDTILSKTILIKE